MKINLRLAILVMTLIVSVLLAGCDEEVQGAPDFWANSYFGQTSPYPKGTLNPAKIEYKYSTPRTVVQTRDRGYLFGGSIRTFEDSNAMVFKLNSKGVVEKGFVVHDGTMRGEDRQSGVITHVLDNGDGYIAAGWVRRDSSINVVLSNTCMWIMKVDYSGNIVWNKSHGLTSYYDDSESDDAVFLNGHVFSLVKTHDGGFLLGGKHLVK